MVDTTWTEVSRTDWRWQDSAGVRSQTRWDFFLGGTIWDRDALNGDETIWDPVYTDLNWTAAGGLNVGTSWSPSGDL